MTRYELAVLTWTRLSEYQGKKLSKNTIVKIVNTVFELLSEAVLRGELIRIDKFGTFRPKTYSSQRSWSHTKQKLIDSRAYMKVQFTMSRGLKEAAKKLLLKKGGPDG